MSAVTEAAKAIHAEACGCGRSHSRCGPQWRAAAAVVVPQVRAAVREPRKRPKRYVEVADYLGMVRRLVRGAGERVATGDPEHLTELVAIRAELDAAILAAVIGLRRSDFSWQRIGDATGTTRQGAIMKWAKAATAALGADSDD